MLNNVLENMEFNRLKNIAINKLNDIKILNQEIDSIFSSLKYKKKQYLQDIHNRNKKVNYLYNNLTTNAKLDDLYRFQSFWAYESCLTEYSDDSVLQTTLYKKFDLVSNGLKSHINYESTLNIIKNILKKYNNEIDKYKYDFDAVVIVTAVPIEFISIVRKLSIILTSSDNNYLEYLLNPDIDIVKKKDDKKSITITGIIERDDKWCKVRVIMPDEYGAESTGNYLSNFKDEYSFRNEILLIGIAGQLDINNKVKIGHLVISNGFYNAYKQKIEAEGISYEDTEMKELCSNYDTENFKFKSWSPTIFNILTPQINDSTKECGNKTIHIGKFVSFHAVNKQTYSKKVLMQKFKDSLAVEMEAQGIFKFINEVQKHLKFKIIKAVCDWSDESKSKEWQPYCAELASEFTVDYLIAKYGKEVE